MIETDKCIKSYFSLETVIMINYLLTLATGIINIVHGLTIYLNDTEESEGK
jgi:hypothetical protein